MSSNNENFGSPEVLNSSPSPFNPSANDGRKRCAIVVLKDLQTGVTANAVAITTGGLQCECFEAPILDAGNVAHAAVIWNIAVLQAKSGSHLQKLILAATENPSLKSVAFASFGQELSNSFALYKEAISTQPTEKFDIIAVGLFGDDAAVRKLTKSFSVLK